MSISEAIEKVLSARGAAVHLCNAYTLSLAVREQRFAAILNEGSLNLPDGMPLVWIARRLGIGSSTERVYGPELMRGCLSQGISRGTRHYLYGSTDVVREGLESAITAQWPAALIVGSESPAFGQLDDSDLDAAHARMVEAGADVVWVGLGTPKQDWVVEQLSARGGPTFVAIGAAFDFLAGTKPTAPRWMQRSGLEWLFRLASEPRRLWRRYVIGIPVFMLGCTRTRPYPLD